MGVNISSLDYHRSVLIETITRFLVPRPNVLLVDVTVGDGGHSESLLRASEPMGRVIGLDVDEEALTRARARLEPFGERFTAVHGNFANLSSILAEQGIDRIDGLLADLGVSTLQIATAQRGFSYLLSGPLSMKMDATATVDAATVVNTYSEEHLWHILKNYGEERHAKRIAREIIKQRNKGRIETTGQLAAIVRKCVPNQHVIKSLARVYQAIRIEVNAELDNLKSLLPQAMDLLRIGGRIAAITYHSLEARIIKTYFAEQEKPCTCPQSFPQCICGNKSRLKILVRHIQPNEVEVEQNPSARSACLRIAEKISD